MSEDYPPYRLHPFQKAKLGLGCLRCARTESWWWHISEHELVIEMEEEMPAVPTKWSNGLEPSDIREIKRIMHSEGRREGHSKEGFIVGRTPTTGRPHTVWLRYNKQKWVVRLNGVPQY